MMAGEGGINSLTDDILYKILAKLPAKSFAAAACVSTTWYRVSIQILSHPKLASALSVNPSLIEGVAEVLDKVLSKPIRPHFAIACISEQYALGVTHLLLSERLGAKTPLVTHISNGVMGKDVLTDELKEVQWEYFDYSNPHPRETDFFEDSNEGIVLVVGYLPGLKVDAVPFFHSKTDHQTTLDYDEFVGAIKDYTADVSSDEFPDAIIMFGDRHCDVNFIASKLDQVMPQETAIVGDAGGCFLFHSLNYEITNPPDSYILDAVALVFAKDKHKPIDVGETQFHVVKAAGLVPFGPQFEVISVGVELSIKQSWFCAKMGGQGAASTIDSVLEFIHKTVEDYQLSSTLYVAVNRRRRRFCRGGIKLATSTVFYHVQEAQGPQFFVDGVGIRPGDTLVFYHRDLETSNTTSAAAFETLKMLKEKTSCDDDDENKNNRDEDMVFVDGVFGGLIFSCNTRGASYFGHPNVDTSTFSLNFPKVPVAGVFCKGEIGRGSSSLINEDHHQQDLSPPNCCLHSCSAVYLVMSYSHAPYL